MGSDEYGGWQEPPRSRREPAHYDPEAEYERALRERAAGRDAGDWTADQAWPADPGTYRAADPYGPEGGYQASDWPGEQDPYGRSDPRRAATDPQGALTDPHAAGPDPRNGAAYYGQPPYEPRGDYPSQPGRGDYPSQPGARDYPSQPGRGDYPSQPGRGDYPSQPGRGDYPSQPGRADYPSQPGRGDYPSQPGRADYPSQPGARGGYPSQPGAGGDYPSQPGRGGYPGQPAPRAGAGYGQDAYGQPYGSPSYPAYPGQEPYGEPAPPEPDTLGGPAAYREQAGYGAGSNGAGDTYQQRPGAYPPDYDSYGAPARSGPMPAYGGGDAYDHVEDGPGWQAQGDRTSASRGRDGEYGRASRPDRRASAYQQEDLGHDGPLGGSTMSGRDMDADDGRHDGFFAGYGGSDEDHYGGGGGGGPRRGRRGRGRAAGMIALIVVVVLLCGAGGVAYHFYSKYKSAHASYSGNGYGTVTVTVPAGATAVTLAPELVRKGVIASSDTFVSYVDTSNDPTGLQPGEFRLHEHMGNAQAWAMLLNPKSAVDSTVTIPDGLPVTLILKKLASSSGIPLSKFQAAIKDTSALGLPSWAKGNPEGFLYPDTYDIVPGSTTALQILQQAVHQFNVEIDPSNLNLAPAAKTAEFTELQVITEASLLEGEVGPKYYADVARTLDNRLAISMPLQLDSTISFITGDYSYTLSAAQRNTPSPYNTFLHTDLPPGPINSPDAAAIQAVLHPAPTSDNWTYFITVNKAGLTKFTNSYSTFLGWSNEATRNGV